ncbi:hypothetical protein ACTXT7_001499 [Hymenolepis weldensis]
MMKRFAAVFEDIFGKCTQTTARLFGTGGRIATCYVFEMGCSNCSEDNHHPLPVTDILIPILNVRKFFVKMDLQVEMKSESRELLTINTRWGLFETAFWN